MSFTYCQTGCSCLRCLSNRCTSKDDSKLLEEKLEYILTCFDFEKVRKTMIALDWAWSGTDGEVPSYYRLIKTAERLLRDAWANKYTTGTGGFMARYNSGELELSFEVTSWESYTEESE